MDRKTVASILNEMSILLELKGENPFKSRAFSNAARIVSTLDIDLEEAAREGTLDQIKGIGESLAEKISEMVLTDNSEYHAELRASLPAGLLDLVKLPGLGPKKVRILFEDMGISTLGELEYACIENRLVTLPGFGRKTQENILKNIEFAKKYSLRFLYPFAWKNAELIQNYLRTNCVLQDVTIAGSLRRKMETVKDIDVLAATDNPESVPDIFTELPGIETVIARGETKTSVKLSNGINVDLRIVSPAQYPYALHHFTGSKEHNTAIRRRAKKLGYKMNEYGLFKGENPVTCQNEEALFKHLGLEYIAPELRENLGEIEAAESGELPVLVDQNDIQGIFHVHSTYSDGMNSLEELVLKIKDHGWQYLGIADHSKSAAYAGGLTEDDIRVQHEEIDLLNDKYPHIRIFKGIESDILPNGDLDYPDRVLETFDFLIISIHSGFRMSRDHMTNRIVNAMTNPYATILGHPTGRLLLSREPYKVDMDSVISVAAEQNIIIEINSHPYRLDLDWREVKKARDKGVMLAVNPDAHNTDGFDDYRYGVGIARKGWLSRHDILNCHHTNTVEDLLNPEKKQMKESGKKLQVRTLMIIKLLRQSYPEAKTALLHSNPFQLLIATISSAQCTDQQVNKVTPGLFTQYPDAKAFSAVKQETLEKAIHSTGFFRNKAKNIIACCTTLHEQYDGKVPESMDELVKLPGIGRKTANVVRGHAFGFPAITVDTHVKRLSHKLKLTRESNPDKIEFDLQKLLPEKDRTFVSHSLILHGRQICKARKPQCPECVLNSHCPSSEM